VERQSPCSTGKLLGDDAFRKRPVGIEENRDRERPVLGHDDSSTLRTSVKSAGTETRGFSASSTS
jgi:hypothetical protein